MKKITLVTGNWTKVAIAKQYLEPLGYKINNVKMDIVKLQADTVEEVIVHSAKYASKELKCNIIINHTGIMIDELNNFPGPYTHYVSRTIGEKGILKLLKGIDNRKAKIIQTLAYCEYGKEPVIFKSISEGTISKRLQGKYGFNWDFIFIPKGKEKTLASYNDGERFEIWSDKCYKQLIKYLEEK